MSGKPPKFVPIKNKISTLSYSFFVGIGDDGIIALCRNLNRRERSSSIAATEEGEEEEKYTPSSKRRRISRSSLSILRVASLPRLTNAAIEAISCMESLIILDIHGCAKVKPFTVYQTVRKLPCLVDIDAKDIALGSPSLSVLLRNDPGAPRTLKFVNQRVFIPSVSMTSTTTADTTTTTAMKTTTTINIARRPNEDMRYSCCMVRSQSQRLAATVPLAPMYHCVDCKLIPALDRGFCVECQQQCHRGHETFLGSYTRFSCDCPFGIDAINVCRAIVSSSDIAAIENTIV